MGANNVLPNVPVFTAGAPTIAQLNALSYAASFLCDDGVRPSWMSFLNNTSAVAANTWTTVPFGNIGYDSDGVFGVTGSTHPATATIVTQGYYSLEACISTQAVATAGTYTGAFMFTAGANNPNYAPAATQYFGYRTSESSVTGSAAADNAICLADITPMALYPGDQIVVRLYLTVAQTVDFNQNTSYTQGRFATKFSGQWMRTGS